MYQIVVFGHLVLRLKQEASKYQEIIVCLVTFTFIIIKCSNHID